MTWVNWPRSRRLRKNEALPAQPPGLGYLNRLSAIPCGAWKRDWVSNCLPEPRGAYPPQPPVPPFSVTSPPLSNVLSDRWPRHGSRERLLQAEFGWFFRERPLIWFSCQSWPSLHEPTLK